MVSVGDLPLSGCQGLAQAGAGLSPGQQEGGEDFVVGRKMSKAVRRSHRHGLARFWWLLETFGWQVARAWPRTEEGLGSVLEKRKETFGIFGWQVARAWPRKPGRGPGKRICTMVVVNQRAVKTWLSAGRCPKLSGGHTGMAWHVFGGCWKPSAVRLPGLGPRQRRV